jgi:hypothetical protein
MELTGKPSCVRYSLSVLLHDDKDGEVIPITKVYDEKFFVLRVIVVYIRINLPVSAASHQPIRDVLNVCVPKAPRW